jgi:hypothetical protein
MNLLRIALGALLLTGLAFFCWAFISLEARLYMAEINQDKAGTKIEIWIDRKSYIEINERNYMININITDCTTSEVLYPFHFDLAKSNVELNKGDNVALTSQYDQDVPVLRGKLCAELDAYNYFAMGMHSNIVEFRQATVQK